MNLSGDGGLLTLETLDKVLIAEGSGQRSDIFAITVAPGKDLVRVNVSRSLNNQVTLQWQASSKSIYRLQYKDRMEDSSWMDHSSVPVVDGNLLSVFDDGGGPQTRFYRLIQNPIPEP